MFNSGDDDDASSSGEPDSPVAPQGPLMSLEDHVALEQAPKLSDRPGWGLAKDIAGKIWNAPNTALGLLYGGAGMAAGEAARLMGLQDKAPRVGLRNNAVQFTNNPLGGAGAITLGNTTTWHGDPFDPTERYWHDRDGTPMQEGKHTYPEHELPHTYQGQQLGPLYLPSNVLGGLNAVLNGEDWQGPHNWNERGPQMDPPRPWPSFK